MSQTAVDPQVIVRYKIISHATESLDGQQNAMSWLEKPSGEFDGRTPFEVLSQSNPDELQRLEDILTALDYGMHT